MSTDTPQTYVELFEAVRACYGLGHSFNIQVSTWRFEGGKIETLWSIYDGEHHHKGATPALAFGVFLASDFQAEGESTEDASARVDVAKLADTDGR